MTNLVTWEIGSSVLQAFRAETQDELDECFRLRWDSYVIKSREIPPDACERRGFETDWADVHSYQLLAKLDGRAVGTFRLIRCDEGCLLTHGHEGEPEVFSGRPFRLPNLFPGSEETISPSATAEASRWVGSMVRIGSNYVFVSLALALAGLRLSREVGIRHWICASKTAARDFLQGEGWPLPEIPGYEGTHLYHGANVHVCAMRVPDIDYPVREAV